MIYFLVFFKGGFEGDIWILNIFMYVGIMFCFNDKSIYFF